MKMDEMKKRIKWFILFLAFCRDYLRGGKDSFVIFCMPNHNNIGDHAIALAEYKFLKDIEGEKKILEVPSSLVKRHPLLLKKMIGNRRIFLHGGGFLGTLWMEEEEAARKVIETFHENRIIIFPQTIYFEDSEFGRREEENSKRIYNRHPNLWLCTREEESYKAAVRLFPKAHILLVPDMVPYLNAFKCRDVRKGILFCFRKDREKSLTENMGEKIEAVVKKLFPKEVIKSMDTISDHNIVRKHREREVKLKLKEFGKSRLVITDRLHGMVFAALTATPCITFGNCNYKVKGVYEWIKNNEYIIFQESLEGLEDNINKLKTMEEIDYDKKALLKRYKPLAEIIKEGEFYAQ